MLQTASTTGSMPCRTQCREMHQTSCTYSTASRYVGTQIRVECTRFFLLCILCMRPCRHDPHHGRALYHDPLCGIRLPEQNDTRTVSALLRRSTFFVQ